MNEKINEDSSMSDEAENSYVKLISSDGHEFLIKRRFAMASGTIRALLNCPGNFTEKDNNEVFFREIASHILSRVAQYFQYKCQYTNSTSEIPEFPIEPEVALDLLMAANFLDC